MFFFFQSIQNEIQMNLDFFLNVYSKQDTKRPWVDGRELCKYQQLTECLLGLL